MYKQRKNSYYLKNMFDLSKGMLKSPSFKPLFFDKIVKKHKKIFLVLKSTEMEKMKKTKPVRNQLLQYVVC